MELEEFLKKVKKEEEELRKKMEELEVSKEIEEGISEEEVFEEKKEKEETEEKIILKPEIEIEVETEQETEVKNEKSLDDVVEKIYKEIDFLDERIKELTEEEMKKRSEEEKKSKLEEFLVETQEILDIYTQDYISEHLDEAKQLLSNLKTRKYPEGVDGKLEKFIKININEFEARIQRTESEKDPETFLKRFLEKVLVFSESLDEKTQSTAKSEFNKLLSEAKSLPKGINEKLEKEIHDSLLKVREDIEGMGKVGDEDRGKKILEIARDLKRKNEFNPDLYNQIAKEFQEIAPKISPPLRNEIKMALSICYENMKKIKGMREEEEKKQQVEGIKIYWGTYLKEVDRLVLELEKEDYSRLFEFYERYNKLKDQFLKIDKSPLPAYEIENVREKLDKCYRLLDRLRMLA